MDQINQIEEQVSSLEQAAYKLDGYSKKLGETHVIYYKVFIIIISQVLKKNTCEIILDYIVTLTLDYIVLLLRR